MNELKKSLLLKITVVATIICMPVLLFLFAKNPAFAGNMILEDVSKKDTSDAVNMTLDSEGDIQVVRGIAEGTVVSLGIPLDYDTETDTISVYEDKASSLIRIRIPTTDKSFYYRNQLTGTQKGISSLVYDYKNKAAEFNITTDGYYISTVHITPGDLYLELSTPKELYGHVFVIDAARGGEDPGNSAYGVCEKDVTLKIAKAISDIAASKGEGGFYLTRSTDEAISDEDREKLIELLKPDVYLTLHVDADGETRVTNGVRGETNELGKGRNVKGLISVIAAENGQQDLGAAVIDDNPGADDQTKAVRRVDIYTGYVTNKAEALKMADDSYAETIAKVIYAWLMQE